MACGGKEEVEMEGLAKRNEERKRRSGEERGRKSGWKDEGGEGRGRVKGNYREGKVLVGGDSVQKKIKKKNRKGKGYAGVSGVVVAGVSLLVLLLFHITSSS